MLCRSDSASLDKKKKRFLNSGEWNKFSLFQETFRGCRCEDELWRMLKRPSSFLVVSLPLSSTSTWSGKRLSDGRSGHKGTGNEVWASISEYLCAAGKVLMKPLKVVIRQIKSLTQYLIVIFTGLEITDSLEQHWAFIHCCPSSDSSEIFVSLLIH